MILAGLIILYPWNITFSILLPLVVIISTFAS
jgi:hypothetical protein